MPYLKKINGRQYWLPQYIFREAMYLAFFLERKGRYIGLPYFF